MSLRWPSLGRRRPRGDRALGPRGERAAARRLRRDGWRVIARNVRSRHGELDLVALDPAHPGVLIVVEVKAGQAGAALPPEVRVTPAKQRKIVALAAELARRRGLGAHAVRFDVIAVDFDAEGHVADLRHHAGAFASHV